MIAAKNFPGWYAIGINDEIQKGDVFVRCSPESGMTPETGESAYFGIGKKFSHYLHLAQEYPYRVYRRGSMISIQRRLRLNPHFSKQLPLP